MPDTEYNLNVLLLLGTDVLVEFLNDCKIEFGEKILQTANLHAPTWHSDVL